MRASALTRIALTFAVLAAVATPRPGGQPPPDTKDPDMIPRPIRALAVPLAAGILLLACQPPPSDTTTVVGDSLTMTTLLDGRFPAGWDIHSMLGWEAEDAQPGLTQRVNDPTRSPCSVAIALGHNDAGQHTGRGPEYGDGFTSTDAAQMRQLRDTLHPATNVLWVLPDYDGTDPVYPAGIEAARSWIAGYAAQRGDDVVDWRPRNTAADIDPDGVHLTPTGRQRYGAMITEEMPTCG